MLLILFHSFDSLAQTAVARIWSDTFGVQDTALKTPVITDAFLNSYIAGTEYNQTSGIDILLRKLDEHGDLLWQASYTNSGAYRDQATDIALDDSGNVYLCGASYVSGNHYDFLVLKFDSSGTLLWDHTLNGSASQGDGASALFIDSGSVFVTGPMTNNSSYVDYRIIRLSAAGVLQWQSTYNFANLADVPFDITVSDGNVFVTGGSQNNISDWDYASIQLLSHNGAPVDTSRTGGTGIGFDHAAEAITDDLGHYYITGTFQNNGNKDFKTIKFDANLNVLWAESFDFDGEDDEAFSLTVDPFGNVYVAGTSRDSSNSQFTIVKYDSTGAQQWVHRSGGLYAVKAARITCDADGNVYATGERHNGFNLDFYTIALDSQGNELWHKLFNGASNGNDRANMILVKDEYILVSGTSVINGTEQYITIAYGTYRLDLPPDTGSTTSDSPNYFYPQLGQILNDTSGTAEVEYYSLHHGPALFLKDEQLSLVWAKTDTSASAQDTLQRIDQVVFNASERRLYEYSESDSYLNYYLPHCGSGITNVHGYKWLSIPDVYRDVNLYYTFNRAGLKQIFVSKPGTKPTIELKYVGADTLIIDTSDGSLEIKGAIGSFKFSRPYAYELDAQGNIIPGTLFYPVYNQTSSGIILFDNISYNVGNALVVVMERWHNQITPCSAIPGNIDQGNLFHSTFYGQTSPGTGGVETYNDYSTSITTDDEGKLYLTGFSNSINFPTTSSAYQSTLAGSIDGFILRFDNNMVLLWSTLIGGTAEDTLTCITYNPNDDDLYFGGTTVSSDHPILPTTQSGNAYWDNSLNGGQDAIFGRIDKDGTIELTTFIGGSGYDKTMGVCITGDLILLTGNSTSTNCTSNCVAPGNGSFPICGSAGNFVQSSNSGGQDIFIMKFEADNSLSWSTLLGSDANEKVYAIEPYPVFRSTGSYFYLCGETQKNSNTGPFDGSVLSNGDLPLNEPNSAAYFQSVAGGFIYEFDNLGNMVWATTLKGVKDLQALTFTNDCIYSAGRMLSGTSTINTCNESASGVSICYTSGEFNQSTGDVYFGRFNTNGQLTYSTRYNGAGNYLNFGATWNLPLDRILFMDSNDNGDIFLLSAASLDPNTPTLNFEVSSPVWTGCYYQPTQINGPNGGQYDCTILSFNSDNERNWATYFGGGATFGSGWGIDWPLFEEWPGGITCYGNKDLFIAGYSGKECFTFPLVDAGITPTGQSYFNDDFTHSYQNTGFFIGNPDYDAFIAKFDMQTVSVGQKEPNESMQNLNAVYPTITENFINIKIDDAFCDLYEIRLLGANSNLIKIYNDRTNGFSQFLRWDLSALSSGLYFIRIIGDNGNAESFRVIKK